MGKVISKDYELKNKEIQVLTLIIYFRNEQLLQFQLLLNSNGNENYKSI